MVKKSLSSNQAAERRRLTQIFADETVGAIILFVTAAVALLLANSTYSASYFNFINSEILIGNLHFTITEWAAELFLAIFFYLVGIELKHEVVSGTLANIRAALIPISAAIGGMIFAALIFISFNLGTENISAWATPISTDVAFAIGVLAIFGKRLASEIRAFLLTLAVVNDLLAILVIAVIYGAKTNFVWLVIAAMLILVFGALQKTKFENWLTLSLFGIAVWYAMVQSGVHATVAGIALGLATRVHPNPGESESLGDQLNRKLRPITSAVFVPLFAFTVTGISFNNFDLSSFTTNKLALGIIFGFIVGQPLGVVLVSFVASKVFKAKLHESLTWWDVYIVGTLASIGFTVAFLVSQIALTGNQSALEISKLAILISNLLAICIAIAAISIRSNFRRHH